MARRNYDDYDREMRERRVRDPRELREREQERLDGRDHRRTEARDPDRMEYTREGRPDPRTTREPTRMVYPYTDQNERDDLLPRGYMDDAQDRYRPPIIELQPERREEPSSRYQDYFLPGEGINREVIQFDICRYLGNDATVRPYTHPDGRQGFLIKAYRPPTTAMISTLKQNSKRYENETALRRRQYGQAGLPYGSAATFDERQRMGRPDAPSEYAGYGMDTTMDDFDDDRGPVRNYREQDPRIDVRMDGRMDGRMDARQDFREDQRQQPPINRHGQMPPPGYPPFPQDQSYLPSSYQVAAVSSGPFDQASIQPRTVGPNNTPPPTMVRGAPAIYAAGGYPVATSGGYSVPTSAPAAGAARYADTTNGRAMANYPGGVPYAPDRHAAARGR